MEQAPPNPRIDWRTVVPPPVWTLVAVAAQRRITGPERQSSFGRSLAAIAWLGSAVVMGSAAVALAKDYTTIDPRFPGNASSLVTRGPFRFSRNPIYLADALALIAHAAYRGRFSALVPVVGLIAVMDRWQIPAEEEALREHFGEVYRRYQNDVPRWLG